MVLSTEWAQVEIIDLVNDGNGLGFMLVGGRSTGVVIKALIPGSVAERDGRLQSGDHVLQIGDVNLRGFSSEQVATVLRQSGPQVRLIVARPVEPTSPDYQALASHAPIIPTKLLTDPDELDRTLLQTAGYTSGAFLQPAIAVVEPSQPPPPPPPPPPLPPPTAGRQRALCQTHIEVVAVNNQANSNNNNNNNNSNGVTLLTGYDTLDSIETVSPDQLASREHAADRTETEQYHHEHHEHQHHEHQPPETPETETYEVELRKNVYGLGITVAGYVCEEEDLSGIFVKSIIEGSAAEMSGRIAINDRIVAVDGRSLAGVSNHQAVEILRNTDIAVRLMLERFLRGRKYEHLQVALIDPVTPHSNGTAGGHQPVLVTVGDGAKLQRTGATNASITASQSQQQLMLAHCLASQCPSQCQSQRCSIVQSPSVTTLSICPARSDADSLVTECDGGIEPELESGTTFDSNVFTLGDAGAGEQSDDVNGNGSGHRDPEPVPASTGGDQHSCDTAGTAPEQEQEQEPRADTVTERWSREVPEHSQIVVADIRKLAGLGISLEGTVEVEAGVEVRPHHYIRSILEDGPVGRDGSLKPGDELLQVNEHRLQGLRHIEVVKILKELPVQVRVICARGTSPPTVINTSRNAEAFEARSLLAGGLQSLQCLQQGILTKAQSESSLYTSSTATLTDQQRSKSVEQVSGLALWTNEVLYCEIEKTERGFGFSILDYQDPLDTDGTVIVVRGLIPGGSAEATNFIFPGDRLVSVNGRSLQGASLDQAVSTLKAIPLGTARIGLCRPLSTSDNNLSSSPDTPTT
ncbi:patj homolog [Anopheles aquasalis]|uniref:patj homolog n=1 Tax=Anopheles aquasalis TaxID=42839 RepID=UPI00215A14FB|nr:patj homolog [Anopheles aquasalis]XP_050099444.1 patj homolog [Anopheles aquasalis]XP_050099445.1 patj homolog [Anopheles aquasalis]